MSFVIPKKPNDRNNLANQSVPLSSEELASAKTQFSDVIKCCNEMLYLIRRLRRQVLAIDEKLGNAATIPHTFNEIMDPVYTTYQTLLRCSSRLPQYLPTIPGLEILTSLYGNEEGSYKAGKIIDSMIDKSNWVEGQFQMFSYFSGFLHHGPSNRKTYFPSTLPPILCGSATRRHQNFTDVLSGVVQEIRARKLGIAVNLLFRTATSSVVEFKFSRNHVQASKEAFLIKFLLVERNGLVEYINMKAPVEDWDYTREYRNKIIEPYGQSRYLCYQLLTKQANKHLTSGFGMTNNWTIDSFIVFIYVFAKLKDVFSGKCFGCKNLLKNYLPPTVFEVRRPGIVFHEDCV